MIEIPARDIDRTIRAYPNASDRDLLRALIKLNKEVEDHGVRIKTAAEKIGKREGHLNVALNQLKERGADVDAFPELAVTFIFATWRPHVLWFGGRFPESADELKNFAIRAANDYVSGDERQATNAIWKILATYMVLAENHSSEAELLSLVDNFDATLISNDPKRSRWHRYFDSDIIDLLRVGLPGSPGHLVGMLSFDPVHILTIPHYAKLLLGIRQAQTNLVLSEETLRRPTTSRVEQRCALRSSATGLVQRKQDGPINLTNAVASLRHGIRNLELDGGESCTLCNVRCMKPILYVELYRCMGAAQRKLAHFDVSLDYRNEARQSFEDAASYVEMLRPTEREIVADYWYSYGYLEFEIALCHDPKWKLFRETLNLARQKFDKAERANQRWAAPLLRIGIIDCFLRAPGIGRQYFADAAAFSEHGESPDHVLTNLLARVCQAAVAGTARPGDPNLVDQVVALFSNSFMPRGPRECHAFDANAIFSLGFQGVSDPSVRKAFNVMIDSGKWGPCQSLEEQREHLHKTLGQK